MKTTILPVRDPQRPERRPPSFAAPSAPDPGGGFEGMHSVSVELLRVKRKYSPPAPAAASPPKPPAAAPAAPAAVEIELPNGRIVRVPPGFSNADLERVLAIASSDDPPAPSGERR